MTPEPWEAAVRDIAGPDATEAERRLIRAALEEAADPPALPPGARQAAMATLRRLPPRYPLAAAVGLWGLAVGAAWGTEALVLRFEPSLAAWAARLGSVAITAAHAPSWDALLAPLVWTAVALGVAAITLVATRQPLRQG